MKNRFYDLKIMVPTIAVVSLLLISGCQLLYDLWPAKVSKTSLIYTGRDPNKYSVLFENVGLAKNLRAEASDIYISSQLDLEYRANLNKEKYKLVIDFLDLSIQQADQERMTMIGTLAQPGWFLSGLLSLLPVGSYVLGYRTQRPEDYNEQEFQTEVSKIKAPV
jgi:hypothetical protein